MNTVSQKSKFSLGPAYAAAKTKFGVTPAQQQRIEGEWAGSMANLTEFSGVLRASVHAVVDFSEGGYTTVTDFMNASTDAMRMFTPDKRSESRLTPA